MMDVSAATAIRIVSHHDPRQVDDDGVQLAPGARARGGADPFGERLKVDQASGQSLVQQAGDVFPLGVGYPQVTRVELRSRLYAPLRLTLVSHAANRSEVS
jgi:hypothetical protein